LNLDFEFWFQTSTTWFALALRLNYNLSDLIKFSVTRGVTLMFCLLGCRSVSEGAHLLAYTRFFLGSIGVSHFYLFVEGKAAKSAVTYVLESIQINKSLHPLLCVSDFFTWSTKTSTDFLSSCFQGVRITCLK
jgi:hypothetical protein